MRVLILFLVTSCLMIIYPNSISATSSSEAVANFLRSYDMARQRHGSQNQDFYIDKHYNFSHITKICYDVCVPQSSQEYVDDGYINKKYPDIIIEEFADKSVQLTNSSDAFAAFMLLPSSSILLQQDIKSEFIKYLVSKNDVFLQVTIIAYRENNLADVIVNFNVKDLKTNQDVFNDKDTRIHVADSGKVTLIKKMATKFSDKLMELIEHQE